MGTAWGRPEDGAPDTAHGAAQGWGQPGEGLPNFSHLPCSEPCARMWTNFSDLDRRVCPTPCRPRRVDTALAVRRSGRRECAGLPWETLCGRSPGTSSRCGRRSRWLGGPTGPGAAAVALPEAQDQPPRRAKHLLLLIGRCEICPWNLNVTYRDSGSLYVCRTRVPNQAPTNVKITKADP